MSDLRESAKWRRILQKADAALRADPNDAEAARWVEIARERVRTLGQEFGRESQDAADRQERTAISLPNVGRAASMGATAGFHDELVGLGGTAPSPAGLPVGGVLGLLGGGGLERYRSRRDAERQAYEEFRSAHPVISGASELAGAIAVPGGAATLPGRGVPGLLRAAGRGAATGGAFGGLAGAGYAENLSDVPGQALRGAGIGAAAGGLLAGGAEGLRQGFFGRSAAQLEGSIAAEGGPAAVRQGAQELAATGRGDFPIATIGPYLRGEAEFATQRSPGLFASQTERVGRLRASEADRLIQDVSYLTGHVQVGDKALREVRDKIFGPLYRSINVPLEPTTRLSRVLNEVADNDLVTGQSARLARRILGDVESGQSVPFERVNALRKLLRDGQETAYRGGAGNTGHAFEVVADRLDNLLEEAVPEFRNIQRAYRDFSRPINVIELAKLETARQGRAAPALDRAGRQLRADLLKEFGSTQRYDDFMRRVAQEGDLAQLQGQALGGSATARRLMAHIQPEDISDVLRQPATGLGRLAARWVPRALRERPATQIGPIVFRPAREIDDALKALEELSRRQSSGAVARGAGPAVAGLFAGRGF